MVERGSVDWAHERNKVFGCVNKDGVGYAVWSRGFERSELANSLVNLVVSYVGELKCWVRVCGILRDIEGALILGCGNKELVEEKMALI